MEWALLAGPVAGLVLALVAVGLGRAWEARAGAAELALAKMLTRIAEANAEHSRALLVEAQRLLTDAAAGDQGLADLAAALDRAHGDTARERAHWLLRTRADAAADRAGPAAAPGAPAPAGEPGGPGPVG